MTPLFTCAAEPDRLRTPVPSYYVYLMGSRVTTNFEPERLRIETNALKRQEKPPRPKGGEHFLKGPIPLSWLTAASRLPGRSLNVGIAIWYLAGLTGSRTVLLSNVAASRFTLDRNAKYRGLEWLEKVGLVEVTRMPGRAPVVSIRDASA